MSRYLTLLAVITVLVAGATGAGAQQSLDSAPDPASDPGPNLDELLERTTAYVAEFVDRFANVVAEERYVQTLPPGQYPRHRELVSDFLLVKPQGTGDEYYQFRDVREVDGELVRDRDERLTTLFLQPWDTAVQQANRIVEEGARYNLVDVGPLNYPLIGIAFLQQHYRDRFDFDLGRPDPDVGSDVRILNFRERRTLAPVFTGALSSGRAWVEEGTGRVVKTEVRIRLDRQRFPIEVTTDFAFDERLRLAVPVEMRGSYPLRSYLTGVATYGRFRTFQVLTNEAVQPQ